MSKTAHSLKCTRTPAKHKLPGSKCRSLSLVFGGTNLLSFLKNKVKVVYGSLKQSLKYFSHLKSVLEVSSAGGAWEEEE